MKAVRWLIPAAGVAALVLLFLLLRPTDDPEPGASPSPSVTGTPATSPTPTTTEGTASPTPIDDSADALQAEIEIEEGQVRVELEGQRLPNPARIEAMEGQRVALRVEADVTDEVRVHGYDLLADVSAGERVTITFRADIPGVFEIELEEAGQLLAQLQVEP